ncbi:MAG TPA: hypothetical protein VJ848_02580, partial [Candidatus Angelobacter sp.]|nr:hypothetical protein [Candidatus Angelobacter sp.]
LEQEGDHYFMTQPGFLWGLFPGFVRLLCTAGAAVLPDNFWLVARYAVEEAASSEILNLQSPITKLLNYQIRS